MKKAGQSPGGGRAISAEEAALWQQATRSLVRVKSKPRVAAALIMTGPAHPAKAGTKEVPAASSGRPAVARKTACGPQPSRQQARAAPPLDVLDRRQARRILAGKTEIEDRLDLHGLRQAEAQARLRGFLHAASAKGLKTVLVITGKGGEPERFDQLAAAMGEHQRGVLRRSVPIWLAQGDLTRIVVSYGAAGPRHGGAGAFYVRLRKLPG
jgi:DNA-nicking Smr family endonuclease